MPASVNTASPPVTLWSVAAASGFRRFMGDVWPLSLDRVLSAPLLSSGLRSTAGAQQMLAAGSETPVGFCAISQPRCLTWP